MNVFWTILDKLIPLYGLIFLGFILGKTLKIDRETIGSLLIYVLAPAVVFFGVMTVKLSLSRMLLPLVFFPICCILCLLFLRLAGHFFSSPAKNILAFKAGSGNTGYFGFPVTVFLFGEEALGIAVLIAFGFILYENTLGFFTTARGNHTQKEALYRMLKLPTVYAFLLALTLNINGIYLSRPLIDLCTNFKGAYSVLGMVMIGLGVSKVQSLKFDYGFIGIAFLAKFVAWPIAVLSLLFLDKHYLHFFDPLTQNVMFLMALVPLPANGVAVATALKAEPEKASVAVLFSTLFALFYIPFMLKWSSI